MDLHRKIVWTQLLSKVLFKKLSLKVTSQFNYYKNNINPEKNSGIQILNKSDEIP